MRLAKNWMPTERIGKWKSPEPATIASVYEKCEIQRIDHVLSNGTVLSAQKSGELCITIMSQQLLQLARVLFSAQSIQVRCDAEKCDESCLIACACSSGCTRIVDANGRGLDVPDICKRRLHKLTA